MKTTIRLCLLMAISGVLFFALSPSEASADTLSVTVLGLTVYENADDDRFGIEGAKVKVCDSDLLGSNCVETTSGADGSFEADLDDTFEDDLGDDLEIYVEILAESGGVVAGPDLSIFTYCYRTLTYVVEDGGTLDLGEEAPLDNSTCGLINTRHTDPRENAGFYVYTELYRARQWLSGITQAVNGSAVPKVTARLVAEGGSDADDVSFYNPVFQTIVLQPDSWQVGSDRGFETIFHEYGHHVLGHFAESPAPNYVNGNCDDVDLFLVFEIPEPGHCKWLPEEGVVAWTEGFPTFLGAVLEKEIYGTSRISGGGFTFPNGGSTFYFEGTEFPPMKIVDTREGVVHNFGDSQGLVDEHPDPDLEHTEGWTIAVLWDVYDAAQDDHDKDGRRDTLAVSFRDIWAVISDHDPDPDDDEHNHPTDLFEFYDGLVELFSDEYTPARIAGPFLENHFDVPATELDLGINTYQDWDSRDVFGRGDVLGAPYEVCRPFGSEVGWGGEGEIGMSLVIPSSGQRFMDFPAVSLPDVAPGACVDGVYEFEIPEDMELFGPFVTTGGVLIENFAVFDTAFCADPRKLVGEEDEGNNCRPSHRLNLQNRPPVVITNAGPDGFNVDEGSSMVIDFTGTYDPDPIPGEEILRYKVTGGGFDTGWEGTGTPIVTLTPDDIAALADGTDPATPVSLVLRVLDGDPDNEFTATGVVVVPLLVNNVEPYVLIDNASTATLPVYTILEGSNAAILGTFVDPGADSWEVEAYFFDADDLVTGLITQVPEAPGDAGTYELMRYFGNQTAGKGMDFLLCLRDDDGGEGCAEGILKVLNVAPVVSVDPVAAVNEGEDTVFSGSFTDPGEDAWTATYAVDGGAPEEMVLAEDKTFSFSVNFFQDGQHSVDVCIHDGTVQACSTVEVEVLNVAPEFSLGEPVELNEGDNLHINGLFTDPGDDPWTATVADNGGAPAPLPLVGMEFTIDRSYPEDGLYSIEVCISDDDATTCRLLEITVLNVAPVVTLETTPELWLVLVQDAVGATFFDPGVEDTHTGTVDWGDGTFEPLVIGSHPTQTGAVSESHAYAETGEYTVAVCVEDDELDAGCASYLIRVVSPEEAVAEAIEDLQSAGVSDGNVASALNELDGDPNRAAAGALDKLQSGDLVSALTKLAKAAEYLGKSPDDYSAVQLLLAQIAESVAREHLAEVEALGLTSAGDLKKLAEIRSLIAGGRARLEAGYFVDAINAFKSSVQKAETLL